MATIVEKGYLEQDFGTTDHLSGAIEYGENSQVEAIIIDKKTALNTQAMLSVDSFESYNTQVEKFINFQNNLRTQETSQIIYSKLINTQAMLSVDSFESFNTQVELFINKQNSIRSQVEGKVLFSNELNTQSEQLLIDSFEGINTEVLQIINKEKPIRTQSRWQIFDEESLNTELQATIENDLDQRNTQYHGTIKSFIDLKTEVTKVIVEHLESYNTQVEAVVEDIRLNNTQVYASNILYTKCGGFLEEGFGETSYLASRICAHLRSQITASIIDDGAYNSQVEAVIEDMRLTNTQYLGQIDSSVDIKTEVTKKIVDHLESNNTQVLCKIVDFTDSICSQVEYRIDVTVSIPSQFQVVFTEVLKTSVTVVIYNTNRPRILVEFPSRGLSGHNWTSNSTEPGDYAIYNVNNDIVEHYWRSATGAVNGLVLTCDTEITQGIFVDTFFVDGHNITSSGVVVLEGSNDNFNNIPFSENLIISGDRIFWIPPMLPIVSYRYWRIRISDPTNPAGYIKIGTIIFGSSRILTKTCAVQQIQVDSTDFKDAVRTEGFTSVANSRAVKRSIKIDFRDVEYESGDYTKLDGIANFARTTLKCLWIPDPRNQSLMRRFAVFGKLRQIPSQTHNVKGSGDNLDHIDMSFEIDEAE